MEQTLGLERVMVRYLLGELSVEERAELETEYFTNPEKFNWLQAIEYDLIEGYVNGKLSSKDRVRFEQNYLTSPVRREKVQFFRILAKTLPTRHSGVSQQVKRPWWQFSLSLFSRYKLSLTLTLAATIMILTAGSVLLIVDTIRLHQQLDRVKSDRDALQNREQALLLEIAEHNAYRDKLARDLKEIQQKVSALSDLAVRTTPAIISFGWNIKEVRSPNRDEKTLRKLVIPSDIDSVRLVFNRRTMSDVNYRVALLTIAGEEIWSRGSINARRLKSGVMFELKVPAMEFKKGIYRLVVSENSTPGESVEIREYHIEVDSR